MMQGLSAADLLTAWEHGHARNPGERALLLLSVASPDIPVEELARITVGERDRLLLQARERTFGREMEAMAHCPGCDEALEFSLLTPALLGDAPQAPARSDAVLSWVDAAGAISFRCPTAGDLAAIGDAVTPEEAEAELLALCVLQSSGDLSAGIPPDVTEAISARMAAADPQAEVLLDLSCPACGHEWQTIFDIVGFFWTELTVQARRLLLEVDALARAYGWPEADILALSPFRRQAYLQLAQSQIPVRGG